MATSENLGEWLAALEARHLANLTFAEAARALRALSSTYVQRRTRLSRRGAFDSAGKRAVYALYYSPLHFLTVQHIVRGLEGHVGRVPQILDVGCGAGAAGAAWASSQDPVARVTGVDAHPWALAEAAFTYRTLEIPGGTRRVDAARLRIPPGVDGVVCGWMVNEVAPDVRRHLKTALLEAAHRGVQVLIVEPMATRVSPWWAEWVHAFGGVGGRADEWRVAVELPELLQRFDRAAGLRHDTLTARSLAAPGPRRA